MLPFASASLRKSLADVTRRKGRTLLVVLGIFIGVFGLTCINFTDDTLVSAFTYSLGYQTTHPDFQMTVDRLDPALLPALQGVSNVQAVQYQSTYAVCWQLSGSRCAINMDIISYPDPQHVPITPFQLTAGSYPGVGEIVLEQGDSSLHGFTVGDTLTLHLDARSTEVRVVGAARTPGANPSASGNALAYMSDAGLQQLVQTLGNPALNGPSGQQVFLFKHQIAVKVRNSAQQGATATTLQQVLQSHGVQVLDTGFAPRPDPSTLTTIDGVFTLLRILALLAVALSGILILNTVTTLVAEQTAIIGTMKAIGGTRGAILRGYLISIGLYSLVATLPGLGLGLYAGYQLAATIAPQIPLVIGPFSVAPWVVALGLVVGFGVPLVAALIPLWVGTRITVRDALAAYGISAGSPSSLLARVGQRLTWISQTTWLGLRGSFRKRWRAALTLLTLGVAGTSFLVVQIATASVNESIGAVRANSSADMTVNFRDPTTYSRISGQLSALPNVQRVERTGATNAQTRWGVLQTYGYEPATQLYHPQLTSGRWLQPGDTNVVLLSDDALRKTSLHVGDTITLTNNYGTPIQLTVTIIGTIHQTIDVLGWIGAAVMPVDTVYELRGQTAAQAASETQQISIEARDRSHTAVDSLAAQVDAVVNPGGDVTRDPGYFDGQGGTIDTTYEYTTRRQGDAILLYVMLYGVALIVGAVGVLGLANALTASVLERRREIGLLRAMGASGRRVARVFWVEGLAMGAVAWCVGALLGLPLAYAFVQLIWQAVMPVDFVADPLAFAVMLAAVLGVASLASVVPAWRASRMRIAEMLRYE